MNAMSFCRLSGETELYPRFHNRRKSTERRKRNRPFAEFQGLPLRLTHESASRQLQRRDQRNAGPDLLHQSPAQARFLSIELR